jgi:hypothetical protein
LDFGLLPPPSLSCLICGFRWPFDSVCVVAIWRNLTNTPKDHLADLNPEAFFSEPRWVFRFPVFCHGMKLGTCTIGSYRQSSSSSASRFTAGAFGFLTLIQC